MTSLLDIAPSKRTVSVSFGELDVPGISILAMVTILKKHPQLLELLQKGEMDIDLNVILDLGADVAASFLAAGLGYPGDDEAEARCKNFKPEDALDIGQAILEETFPKGAKSFLEKITKAMSSISMQAKALESNSLNNSLKPVKD